MFCNRKKGSRCRVQGCGGGIAANKYGAMPEGLRVAGFPRIASLPRVGKTKRRRLRRPKRKPTPPHCARQPLPREGARVDTPSFLWKEVPRRGGGWVRKGVYEEICSTASARRHFPITACMLISVVQSRSLHCGRDDDTGTRHSTLPPSA